MSNGEDRDVSMADGGSDGEAADDAYDILLGGVKKLVVLPGHSTQAASFQIEKEDHTLGNALRYFINKNPEVEFCGYTIPHPSETKMHIRIQVWEDSTLTVFEALKKGLEDMIEACDVVTEKFTEARDDFNEDPENHKKNWNVKR